MKKTSKKIAMLILIYSFVQTQVQVQAEEQKPASSPSIYIPKSGTWLLRQHDFLDEDRINPICLKLEEEFQKYNHIKNIYHSENVGLYAACGNNILSSFEGFSEIPWSDPEDFSKHKGLVYELAKLFHQGKKYYFTGIHETDPRKPGYKRKIPDDWEIADAYSRMINGTPRQFQFWDVEIKTPYNKESPTYKTTIARVSYLRSKPSPYLCEGYPKIEDSNKEWAVFYFVNEDRTAFIDPSKFMRGNTKIWQRLLLYKNFLFTVEIDVYKHLDISGLNLSTHIVIPSEDNDEDNSFNCKMIFWEDR